MRIAKDPKERKEEIIKVSRELFEKNGVANTKVSDIVGRIGVAQGLFYYYFKSKDKVVLAVMEQLLSEIDVSIQEILNNKNIDFYQKTIKFIELYRDISQKFLGHSIDSEDILNIDMRKSAEEHILKNLYTLVDLGSQEGILKLQYPEMMAKVLFYGLKEVRRMEHINHHTLLTMFEQGLNLPYGAISG